ncbi:SPFH domain-containing protein [Microbulbifer thermotolerans]|uniref:Band 7 protein n=1 Tax=Microbulbifer thermotolerans TaxID=252514 RepID=A0A143HQ52_MICTH|nr:SPFH domain-containing protein [Microbulbifer thermotolerans]AMX03626.1 Band 7 protein [Microbulbifer thermotolerans]MCX2781008.1 SPFH domain-containing protein [Microbulbifer thermotolerans]MCX2782111.1 SPFH domain-containing protein [Microbulbifer thermotolerans]MCX2796086.1 SPFH domain-containing protein [Microbulbifer thermotolerans]MCX2801228.1 SPFH domain-containing protein [Microbulbifer thermotolerans]
MRSVWVWILVVVALGLSACGDRVEVPPAHVGKILTKNGYKPETVPPSKFRLDMCFYYCDKLITLATADFGHREQFQLFMPKDQLNMSFDVRMTGAVNNEMIDNIFDRIPPTNNNISVNHIYGTYAQPVIRDVVRRVVAKYSINEIASSREALSQELFSEVKEALKGTPIVIKRLGLADVQFPKVITEAKERAAERRELIEQEKAQFEIQKIQMERDLEREKMNRAIAREKALGQKEVNDLLAKSVTDKYLAYRTLEVLEAMAESDNKVFVPVEALGTIGLQQAVFSNEVKHVAKKRQ